MVVLAGVTTGEAVLANAGDPGASHEYVYVPLVGDVIPNVNEAPEQMLSSAIVATVNEGDTVTVTGVRGPVQPLMLLCT